MGCIVQNVGTCIAIADAVQKGVPLLERIVTITGSAIKEPQNMLVRIGTPVTDLIEQCGGFTSNLRKLILGGPMMGIASRERIICRLLRVPPVFFVWRTVKLRKMKSGRASAVRSALKSAR